MINLFKKTKSIQNVYNINNKINIKVQHQLEKKKEKKGAELRWVDHTEH